MYSVHRYVPVCVCACVRMCISTWLQSQLLSMPNLQIINTFLPVVCIGGYSEETDGAFKILELAS